MLVAQAGPFLDVSPQVLQGLVSACGSWEGQCVEMGASSSGKQPLPVMGQPKGAWGTCLWTKHKELPLGVCPVWGRPPAAEGPRAGRAFLCLFCLPHHPEVPLSWCLGWCMFYLQVGLSLGRFGQLSPVGGIQPLLSQPRDSFFILGHL